MQDGTRKYAPLWVLLFSAGTTLTRMVGQRFVLQREWDVSWKDVRAALTGAAVGYAAFRLRYGNEKEGIFTR